MTAEHHETVRLVIPPARISLFASFFEAEGLNVGYEPPIEERGAVQQVAEVLLDVASDARGAAVGIAVDRAIRKLRERFPKAVVERLPSVEIHGNAETPKPNEES